jgi:GntR family transcriptional regulator/MocR family aminotransferase
MDIHITLQGTSDLSGQIYRQLRESIMDGRLQADARLPSTRALALQLGVSRKTTLDVYEQLISEGFLETRTGHGTFVASYLERVPVVHGHLYTQPHPPPILARPAAIWDSIPDSLALPRPGSALPLDFLGGVTDKANFPATAWRRCINVALRAQLHGRGMYHDPAGEQALRLAISRYLAFNRAVVSNWHDVIVTQGAQQALDLIARAMLMPGDIVAMEDPGYPPARACFTALGAKVVSVPVDAHGIDIARLPKDAKLVYVTPSHQFPLGMPMSLERRIALLQWAQTTGAVIIEDDYDSEYRFEGRPMESLKSLDRAGLVAYVGTFSKTIFPELRIGYLIAPESLQHTLLKAKQISDRHSCSLTQAALARFMLDGDFAKHLRRMQKQYALRRLCLLQHLQGELAVWFEVVAPSAGIHMTAILKQGLTEAEVIRAARSASIGLYGIADFHVDVSARAGLLFGYGSMDSAQIEQAMQTLKGILQKLTSTR